MAPFLLLATRPEDDAAREEYAGFRHAMGLDEAELVWRRLDREPLGEVDLDAWSGIVLGGSPYTVTDPVAKKSAAELRVERELKGLLDRVVAADVPFLGCCYGIGTLGTCVGATVDRQFAEGLGAVTVSLTDEGREDPLLGVLPPDFAAYVGHKEAVSALPPHAVRLAGSATCPVQAFRVGRRVYATQFHPELDVAGIRTRIRVYRHAGYFRPEQAEELLVTIGEVPVEHPPALLRRFVELYAR